MPYRAEEFLRSIRTSKRVPEAGSVSAAAALIVRITTVLALSTSSETN